MALLTWIYAFMVARLFHDSAGSHLVKQRVAELSQFDDFEFDFEGDTPLDLDPANPTHHNENTPQTDGEYNNENVNNNGKTPMLVRNLAIDAARLELTHYPTRLPRLQGIIAGRVTDFQSVLPIKKLPIELSPAHVQHMEVLQACMYVLSTWVM